jgi:hypothetical protein
MVTPGQVQIPLWLEPREAPGSGQQFTLTPFSSCQSFVVTLSTLRLVNKQLTITKEASNQITSKSRSENPHYKNLNPILSEERGRNPGFHTPLETGSIILNSW